jgi:hypothetical protein
MICVNERSLELESLLVGLLVYASYKAYLSYLPYLPTSQRI